MTEHCEISQSAKDKLMKPKREGGSFAPLMLTTHADGSGASVAVYGFGCHLVSPLIGRTCDLSVLDKIQVVVNNPPEEFKEFVDQQIKEQ